MKDPTTDPQVSKLLVFPHKVIVSFGKDSGYMGAARYQRPLDSTWAKQLEDTFSKPSNIKCVD